MKTPTNQPTNQLINKTIQVVVLIMFLFSVNSSLIIAQDSFLDICVTPDTNEADPEGVHSYSKNPEVLNAMEPVVVNIFIGKSMTRKEMPAHKHSMSKAY